MAQVEVDPTQDTEFHDALRRHGIIPPKPPSRSPSPELPSASDLRSDALGRVSQQQIDQLLDGETVRRTSQLRARVDDEDEDEDELLRLDEDDDAERKLLLRLREQRMAEMRVREKRARFGRVYPISRVDYTREVTEASKEDPDRPQGADTAERSSAAAGDAAGQSGSKGTAVVCYLYKDGLEQCKLLGGYLDTIAMKNPATKFVSIVGDKCIPNYPDRNLPTLLIYKNGELHRQIVGLRPEIGLDGMNTRLADVELLLTAVGAIERPAPSKPSQEQAEQDEDEEAAGSRRTGGIRHGTTGGGGAGTGIRSSTKTQEELDAELDWDL